MLHHGSHVVYTRTCRIVNQACRIHVRRTGYTSRAIFNAKSFFDTFLLGQVLIAALEGYADGKV